MVVLEIQMLMDLQVQQDKEIVEEKEHLIIILKEGLILEVEAVVLDLVEVMVGIMRMRLVHM